jgi:hypothetical protein
MKQYPTFFTGMDSFVEDGKLLKMTSALVTPLESQTEGNIKKVRQLLLQNFHLSLQMIVDELDISKDTVQKIVVEDLGWGLCARYVPHSLTAEQEDRVAAGFLQSKALLFFTTTSTCQIWHLRTDFSSLK